MLARARWCVAVVTAIILVAGCTSSSTPSRTEPTPSGDQAPNGGPVSAVQAAVDAMSLRELVGQLFVASYSGTRPPIDLVRRFHLGGVIVEAANIASVDAIAAANKRLQAAVDRPWPLIVSVDQEGGTVQRVGAPMTQFPTYLSMGAAQDPSLAREVAHASGKELRAAGFTMVFAPDADVTIGGQDPTIRSRSAGADADDVARLVAASTRGYLQSGIVPVLKHFPGHGSVTVNSHRALPHQRATLKALERRDFEPFAAGITAGAPAVMVGHIALDYVDRGVPADLSRPVISLLASQFGFDGLVVTDALNMAAVTQHYSPARSAVAALRAGAELLVMPADLRAAYRGVLAAVRDGRLNRDELERAAVEIGGVMRRQAERPVPPPTVIGSHAALSRRLSALALTLVAGPCSGPYATRPIRAVGEPYLVAAFEAAARQAGLPLGRGTTVALLGDSPPKRRVDIAVAVGAPYVLAKARAPVKLASFGWTPGAMDAVVAALRSARPPHGRLPVRIFGLAPNRCASGTGSSGPR